MHDQQLGATERLARFVVETGDDALPIAALSAAHTSLIDGFGVALAGVGEPSAVIARNFVAECGGALESAIIGTSLRVPAAAAAFANGIATHAHDFDDTQISDSPDRIYGLLTHPTPSALGAAYAAAELSGASGRRLLAAFAIALETSCRLCDAISPFHYIRGFHTTGTIAVFGATAAAGRLFGLDVQQMRNAFGIAASMSAGLRTAFGTMTKPLHAGRAAENGVVAARLARAGFDGRDDVFENPRGFFKTVGASYDAVAPELVDDPLWGYGRITDEGFDEARLLDGLGHRFLLVSPGLSIKPYPSVVLSHPSMDTMLALITEHDVQPQDVDEIELHGGPSVLNVKYHRPQTGTEGKFSVEFCLVCILILRRALLSDFNDDFVRSPQVQDLVARVKPVRDAEIERAGFSGISSRIVLRLKDGRCLERASGAYRGSPDNPLDRHGIDAKFVGCAETLLSAAGAKQALDTLRNIESLANVRDLASHLTPG